MKKSFLLTACAAVAMMSIMMVSCKPKNAPDDPTKQENPLTDEEPGSKEWLEDLTTGEDSVEIKAYDASDLVGCWRLAAVAQKDKDGNILSYGDSYVYGDLDRGYSILYLQLFADFTSAYSMYHKENGVPVVRTAKGTWSLNKNQITLNDREWTGGLTGIVYQHMTIDLLEKNRIVLKSTFTDNGKGQSGTYYEIYNREDLPDLTKTKTPQELFVTTTWKVAADTICINAIKWGDGGYIDKEERLNKEVNQFKGYTFNFKQDSTLVLTDASGNVKTYKWTWLLPSINDPLDISFRISEIKDAWPAPQLTEFNSYLEATEYGHEKTYLKLFAWTREGVQIPAGFNDATKDLEITLEPEK